MGTSFAASISPAFSFSPLTNGHANGHGHHAHHLHHSPSLTSHTPTTPSLLAAYSASALLSNRRLRLIASMFVQMCEAVALCHDVGVSHRDIKPENFICCDSQELSALPRGDDEVAFYDKRKVIVKLTDFGLATSEERNTDVECGSRPYMAFGG
jgi:serine/threonine protein kinase